MHPIILSIAALDSSGGAGISQDTRVTYLHGCRLLNCCTGITIQTEAGLQAVSPTAPDFFEQILHSMLKSYQVDAIKIGALCSLKQINILSNTLRSGNNIPVIFDPVIRPTLGNSFVSEAEQSDYLKLLPAVNYLSPNLPELDYLSGYPTSTWKAAKLAATYLSREYNLSVLLKGGHSQSRRINEGLISSTDNYIFTKARHNWSYTHGTGCALSTAFACNLSLGFAPNVAFKKASLWLSRYYSRLQ